jgi:D-tyrosyl-tRNA(Tyr) deacylase
MIGVIQRVSNAEVRVRGKWVSGIAGGVLLLVGIAREDGPEDISYLVNKTVHLRIFGDEQGHLNKSLLDRPSFTDAAKPAQAEALYQRIIEKFKEYDIPVKEGVFRAIMEIKLTNQGPVTIIINTKDKKPRNNPLR